MAATGGTLLAALSGFKLEALFDPQSFMQHAGAPLGLSCYTFRGLHLLIDRYEGKLGAVTAKDVAAYLVFLPTFVIGPIHRYPEFVRDQARQRFDRDQIVTGVERIVVGYAKTVILSNFVVEMLLGQLIADIAPHSVRLATYLAIVQDGLRGC